MKRWALGLLVAGFSAGGAFVLSTILINIFGVYLHSASSQRTWLDVHAVSLAIAVAVVVGIASLYTWFAVTRES